jgi:thimet oligopeptidase
MKSESRTLAKAEHFYRNAIRVLATLVILTGAIACSLQQPEDDVELRPVAEAVVWPDFEDPQAQNFTAICRADLQLAQQQFDALQTHPAPYGDQELLKDINQLDIVIDRAISKASLYRNVHPNAEVRNAADGCQQKFVVLMSDIGLSRPLYQHLVDVDVSALSTLDKRYVDTMLEDFRRSGVNQDADTRARIRELNEEINLIGQNFDSNIREDVRSIEVDSTEELAGLPQDYIDAHQPNAEGKIIITTNYPDYLPVMKYAHSDDLRYRLYKVFRNRGYPANHDVLRALLEKRYELAQLLEYENFSEYVTEDKMIESPEHAQMFIDKVSAIAAPRVAAEYEILLKRLQQISPGATEVGDWQKDYLEDLVKREHFQVDSQAIRQYFSYENVRQGIFDLAEAMFGIEIEPWQTKTWHESVESYQIMENGNVIGRFHLDMHPREGKYKHAAAFGLQEGVKGIQLPIAALVCNFPGGDASAGYMEHSQVETFLHEFGHLLHGIFAGQQPWLGLSGIRTEWDFVEAPSQMLEEWVWDAETLKTFARNPAGETIPDALVKKMNAGRDFGRGLWAQHQMFYAAVSLNYYNRPPDTFSLDDMMQSLQAAYSPFGYVDGTHFYASFGHLDGYSSIYYTYMWSLVIASDMFSEFEAHGLRNPAVAQRYRAAVLAPGGSKDAAELVKDFLGRPYNFEAFAEDLNENSL